MVNMHLKSEVRGVTESIRYLLHYGGEKLGELRHHIVKWLEAVEAGIESFDLHHAVAVAQCLGTALDLVTGEHWTDAGLVTLAHKIYDMLKDAEIWYNEKDKEKKAADLHKLKKDVIDGCLELLEKIVELNNGHFSTKMTWLDFFFVAAIEVLEHYLGMSLLKDTYPALYALAKKIWELPEIKDYISKRGSKILF